MEVNTYKQGLDQCIEFISNPENFMMKEHTHTTQQIEGLAREIEQSHQAQEEFNLHKNNELIHVTEEEKEEWNSIYERLYQFILDKFQEVDNMKVIVLEDGKTHFDVEDPEEKVFYFEKSSEESENLYDEYVYFNNTWEKIGSNKINLSDYYTKEEVVELINVVTTKMEKGYGELNAKKLDEADFSLHTSDDFIHVTKEEKDRWNSAHGLTVDTELDENSINPVQNAAIAKKIATLATQEQVGEKVSNDVFVLHTSNGDIHITEEERVKWNEALERAKEYADQLFGDIESFKIIIIEEGKTHSDITPESGVLYFEKTSTDDENNYDEYVYINGVWEKIGSNKINLSDYYTKSETYSKEEIDEKFLTITITCDDVLSETSDNPVKNKVIATEIKELKETVTNHTTDMTTHVTQQEKDTWNANQTDISQEEGNAIEEKSDGLFVQDMSADIQSMKEKTNLINYAQKTVNKKGVYELLSQIHSYTLSNATAWGVGISTIINEDISLDDDITNYDKIRILYAPATSTRKRTPQFTEFIVSNIIYNNSDTEIVNDGSNFVMIFNVDNSNSQTSGSIHFAIKGWFKDTKTIRIAVINNAALESWNNMTIVAVQGINEDSVLIDPVEYVNSDSGIEDTPVGHIIPYMGNTAPAHYLVCDGTEYNIADYPYLAQHFQDEFGSVNYFGGDGTTTFAVPDLRGEFLRGSGTATRGTGEGKAVGGHQDPTYIPRIIGDRDRFEYVAASTSNDGKGDPKNVDSRYSSDTTSNYMLSETSTVWQTYTDGSQATHFALRPTNTSVLYCIKYEPTYFMKYVNEKASFDSTVLFDGDAKTVGNYTMVDDISKYEYLLVETSSGHSNHGFAPTEYNDAAKSTTLIRVSDIHIGLNPNNGSDQFVKTQYYTSSWYYFISYWFNSTTQFRIDELYSNNFDTPRIKKITGIKGNISSEKETSYSDEEIHDAVALVLGGAE